MAVYSKTWWGSKWLEPLAEICDHARFLRGKNYANNGKVYNIKVDNNYIIAKMKGTNGRKLYKIEMYLDVFTKQECDKIVEIITSSPSILSALLNKNLSVNLFEKLKEADIALIPNIKKSVKVYCNCYDWEEPCKHIVAVFFIIAAEIDKNPFFLFNMRNCKIQELISDASERKLTISNDVLAIETVLEKSKLTKTRIDHSLLELVDFSKINDLSESIYGILKNAPPFYNKDFKNTFIEVHKYWQRHYASNFIQKIHDADSIARVNNETREDKNNLYIAHYAESLPSICLVIDKYFHLTKILSLDDVVFAEAEDQLFTLTKFLYEMPYETLHKLCYELRFLHMIFLFSLKLMDKSAYVPQILQNKKKETIIRWVPALFDVEVKRIFDFLCSLCPQRLVKFGKSTIKTEEQVKIIIGLFLSVFMKVSFSKTIAKNENQDVFKIFFLQEYCKFNIFSNKEIPSSINRWLSNFYIKEKLYRIYLKLEERENSFELDVQISTNDYQSPISIYDFYKSDQITNKISLMSDIFIITEYIPEVESLLDNGKTIELQINELNTLFANILPILKIVGIDVILPKSLHDIIRPQLKLNLQSTKKITNDRQSFLNLDNLLEFNWEIAIGDKNISVVDFKKLLDESRGIVKMAERYVFLDDLELKNLLKKLEKLPVKLPQSELMQAVLSGELGGAIVNYDNKIANLFNTLDTYKKVYVPTNITATLRPYQERGFNWLLQNIMIGFGSILADDMGLGKTLQVIATIQHLKNENYCNKDNRVLVVAPASLLHNWRKEISKFAPDLKLYIYHGNNRDLLEDFDILITSYGLVRREYKKLDSIKWFLLILDEAQNIKNPHVEQTKIIKSMNAQHKIALSGTPIENRLLEYWSIFDFTNRNYLGTMGQFREKFSYLIERDHNQECLSRFKKIIRPFVLRRLKNDKTIITDLPEKIELDRYCSLTKEQTSLYQEIVNRTMEQIEKLEGIERKGMVLKLINSLKQICNHPSQFLNLGEANIEQSGKMEMLEEILLEIENSGEKSLIFTQYTAMGEIIVKLIEQKFCTKIPFFHGGLSLKKRDQMVADFQNLSSVKTMVVSLKAGGTGLNLTAASHVIHFDLWWNPAVETQATDRAYRIGQSRNVMVHRFITTGTFEEKIDEMIKSKKELADLTAGSNENWITEMTTEQLKDLVNLKSF